MCADAHALSSAVKGSWLALLIARLLLEQPTRRRWQLSETMADSGDGLIQEDAFQACLYALLQDNPYGAMHSLRSQYGDGWLLCHLWDLLCRARAVPVDDVAAESSLTIRQTLLLYYAKSLGKDDALWQLAAAYGGDLLAQSSAASEARKWMASMLRERARAAVGASGGDRLHCVKLRKLLHVCEKHGLKSTAEMILNDRAQASRTSGLSAVQELQARAELSIGDDIDITACELGRLAMRAFDKAISAENATDPLGGDALAELRARIRSDGVAGPAYFQGPSWLPIYIDFLELLAKLALSGNHLGGEASVGGSCVEMNGKALRQLAIALCVSDDSGSCYAAAHLAVSRRILQFLAGSGKMAPQSHLELYCLTGATRGKPLALGARDAYALVSHSEDLLALAFAEFAASESHERREEERARAKALSNALADAILRDAEVANANKCWGAGC
mmetsp:Transcript_16866/g.47003  ORF Transcript_16866/g.47003 Transcript_16866/m.47003 type:complete len:449 (+) Transcript_16866:325-1671(+)